MFKFSRDVPRFFALAFAVLLLQSGMSIAQVSVSLPNVTGQAAGTSVVLPIAVGNLTGQSVSAYQFTMTYDTTVVKITGYDATATLSSGMTIVLNTTTPGVIYVSAAGANNLTGSGVLLKLDGTFTGTGTSPLTFTTFQFNEGTPAASPKNGSIGGTFALTVSVPAVADSVGAAVMIPINTDTITGKSVYAYQFTVSYNDTVLQLTGNGYSTTGSISAAQGLSLDASTGTGTITIAAAGTAPLAGSGALIYLTGKILKAGTGTIQLAGFEYNEGTPATGTSAGSVTGVSKPVISSFTPATLSKVQLNSSQTFSVTATASTPSDTLTYAWSVNGTVKQTSKSNSFTTTLSDSGNTIVKVVVSDLYGLSASNSWNFLVTGVEKVPGTPKSFELGQNYPNPFNPTTTISFDLPKLENVRIVVYDILGREVRTLVDQEMAAGRYHVMWNGTNDKGQGVSTGVYFYRMEAGNFISLKKMLLVK